jgi:hypothetical protein
MRRGIVVVASLALLASACIGETPDDRERAALAGGGGGPTHRPGEPCLLCHDFALAGTVYQRATDTAGVAGAQVSVTDDRGHAFTATTNQVGTFYVTVDGATSSPTARGEGHLTIPWSLAFPLRVSVARGGLTKKMRSFIHREAGCGECHKPAKGAASAGRIFVEATP